LFPWRCLKSPQPWTSARTQARNSVFERRSLRSTAEENVCYRCPSILRGQPMSRTFRTWHVNAMLFSLALVLRLAYLALFGGLDGVIHDSFEDQYLYLDIARNVASGKGFVTSTDLWVATAGQPSSLVAPAYPVTLALIFRLTGESLIIVRLLQVLVSAA